MFLDKGLCRQYTEYYVDQSGACCPQHKDTHTCIQYAHTEQLHRASDGKFYDRKRIKYCEPLRVTEKISQPGLFLFANQGRDAELLRSPDEKGLQITKGETISKTDPNQNLGIQNYPFDCYIKMPRLHHSF